MMSREYPSPTCPVRARWNSSLTDMRPLAIPRIQSWPPLARRVMFCMLNCSQLSPDQQQSKSITNERKHFSTESSQFHCCISTDRIVRFKSCPGIPSPAEHGTAEPQSCHHSSHMGGKTPGHGQSLFQEPSTGRRSGRKGTSDQRSDRNKTDGTSAFPQATH